ncbi:helix-turn-helix transcriptional regulator [Pseudoduganella sp. LjRoot289]|uniref:helix-turn-helix domain-containing protein n=1 Tax=Pseudoduganella sp. LjRoot289 TaxID=3342314 RepID=UPI003ECD16A3
MKTHSEISAALRTAMNRRGMSQAVLREEAGIAQRTLTNVLSGQEDFKVSTLFALADRLGLELLLVPKDAVKAVSSSQVTAPVVQTKIGQLIAKMKASE